VTTATAILGDGSLIFVGSFFGNMQIGNTNLSAGWHRWEYPFAAKISSTGEYLYF
jgi:hypothetical protein